VPVPIVRRKPDGYLSVPCAKVRNQGVMQFGWYFGQKFTYITYMP
jgi:hypothetical protein